MNTPTTEAGLEVAKLLELYADKLEEDVLDSRKAYFGGSADRAAPIMRQAASRIVEADVREAATRAEVERLKTALEAFCKAHEMPITGDTSGFEWGKQTMRYPGEHSGGYICSKHGLGYTGSCICCRDEFARHEERLERAARWDRDTALSEANRTARSGLTATATKKN